MRWIAAAGLLLVPAPLLAQPPGLKLPAGFEVVEYADSRLANDIYCMTVDPRGRIVVAGRGYLRVLVEDNDSGRATHAIDLAGAPKDGAMGLCWEGDTLYFTGDGGLRRLRIKDDQSVGPSELVRAMRTGGEHAAHAISRGPDGWLYVLCGNNTGIDRSFAQTANSPVKQPIAGCVVRFSPDLRQSEIVAHGFRNAYGMDFDLDGALYTFDSDNERCVSLPWYEPTRLYRVIDGGFYGWLNPQRASFWRLPPYSFDVIAPSATLGRGSPTGVVCYRHAQFPTKYRGGLFLGDWTFGRIYFVPQAQPAERKPPEVFLAAVGDSGFAPTALVLHPRTGDLFVATGGRGTRGAVYRIRYTAGLATALKTGLTKIVPPANRDPGIAAADSRSLDVDLTASADALRQAQALLFGPAPSPSALRQRQLHGVRLLQRYVGDVGARRQLGTIWEGYTPRQDGAKLALAPRLAALFPTHDFALDVELARTLAMVAYADQALRERILAKLTPQSSPIDDIHYLAVFARLPGERSPAMTAASATALLDLDRKLAERRLNRDSNWPLRVRELYAGLAQQDRQLHEAVASHAQFGRPDHALFAQSPGFPRRRAAQAFLDHLRKDGDYALSAAVVDILGALPADEVVPVLRKLWGQTGQDAAIVTQLARAPQPDDRPRFVEGLGSSQPATVQAALRGLSQLPDQDDGAEVLALLLALKRVPEGQQPLRAALLQRVQRLSKQTWAAAEPAWLDWFAQAYPKLAPRLTNPDGVDVAAWSKRLARLAWDAGDAERGKRVFHKASCASCHSGSQAVGPDLTGVARRFSRADLFTAIVQPSREVPARYQVTVAETRDGKVYQGLVIYDAVDSLLLQSGPSTTVRVDGQSIVSRRTAPVSLMPAGLLDPLSDTEIVDLDAYLRTLNR